MEPVFKDLPEFHIVGLAGKFAVGKTEGIPRLWNDFIQRWQAAGRPFPEVSYGVCYDESAGAADGSRPFTYLAAFPLGDPADAPAGFETRTIPASRYAVFTHRGRVFDIKESYEHIYGTWMPQSGCRPSGGPEFELYDERFDAESMSGQVDIYVPVVTSS